MRSQKIIQSRDAFTLIELMIVVAIVGILSALSIQNYRSRQRKALQSESKIALASVYNLEKSFYSEYSAYIPGFDSIGYSPEGYRQYYQKILCYTGPWAGTVTGYAGAANVEVISPVNTPYTNTGAVGPGVCAQLTCAAYGNDSQKFLSYTQGNLGLPNDDIWQIDQYKNLSNCEPAY